MYIAFEGIDGSGKTTAARYFESCLKFVKTLFIQEPGGDGSEFCDSIKKLLLDNMGSIDVMTELMLILAARNELYLTINKAKKENYYIISDRCYVSSLVYQSSINNIKSIFELTTGVVYPDYVVYMDCSVDIALARMDSNDPVKKKNVYELSEIYQDVLKQEESNFSVIRIDSNRPLSEVKKDIQNLATSFLPQLKFVSPLL